jgi:hypothetical protein
MRIAHACDQIFSFVEKPANPYSDNRPDAINANRDNEFGAE